MARRELPSPTIEQVHSRFQQWRKSRQGRAPIPDELWEAAAELARRDGVNRTATALGLDGGKLKQRIGESAAAATLPTATAPTAFVEPRAPANPGAGQPGRQPARLHHRTGGPSRQAAAHPLSRDYGRGVS